MSGEKPEEELDRDGESVPSKGTTGRKEAGHLAGKTQFVPASNETVRLKLKPWPRGSWKIRGDISRIKRDDGEDTMVEVLNDLFGVPYMNGTDQCP
eukprot:evm.model.scf_355.1 EVM.evm.TU.scf_355.1   scf_355:1740-2257(-)